MKRFNVKRMAKVAKRKKPLKFDYIPLSTTIPKGTWVVFKYSIRYTYGRITAKQRIRVELPPLGTKVLLVCIKKGKTISLKKSFTFDKQRRKQLFAA